MSRRTKGTEVSSLPRDKGTTGQVQNLFTDGLGRNFDILLWDRPGTGLNFDILPWDRLGRSFDSLSRPIPEYPGTATGQKEQKVKKYNLGKIFFSILTFLMFFCLGTDKFVPGFLLLLLGQRIFFVPEQRDGTSCPSLSWDVASLGKAENVLEYQQNKISQ